MTLAEVLLIGVALSMDAFAVGLTNGMVEPRMKSGKVILIALFYGGFQFLMPVLGYWGGYAFSALVEKIAPWLSFALLGFIGGKMIYESRNEEENALRPLSGGHPLVQKKLLSVEKLTVQAFATSIDALAVGVSLLAQETSGGLPYPAVICASLIGVVTFSLSVVAVELGRTAGNALSDKAETLGGGILVIIGVKLLLEGIL